MQQSSFLPNLFQTLKPFENEDENHSQELLPETVDPEKQENPEDQSEEDDGVWVEVCRKTTRIRRRRKGVYWNDLPRDIMVIILSKMELVDMLATVPLVCQLWRKISKQPGTVRHIDLRTYSSSYSKQILNFVTKAVDRSSGKLVEFTAHRYVSDEIVDYVVSNTKMLKALRFSCRSYITNGGLVSAMRKAPFLEEVELYGADCNNEVAEEIVRSCPQLKCFRINIHNGHRDHKERLIQGLDIVVEGCPNLECLDLEFVDVDLNQVWLVKWGGRVRTLKPPKERSDGYRNNDHYGYPFGYNDDDAYYFKYGRDWSYYYTSCCSSDDEKDDDRICDLLPPKATACYI